MKTKQSAWMDSPGVWLCVVVLLAAAIRFLGIWHEFPFSYYGDEQQMVKQALAYGTGDLNPYRTGMNSSKPAFYTYILFIEYGFYFVVGKLAGWWQGASEYAIAFLERPGPWYIIGRSTTTLFGVATVFVVGITGEKFYGRWTGVLAGLILTFAMGHVITSQHVKADVPTAFFGIVAFYFLLNLVETRRMRYLVLASIAAGLGMATKYYSILLVPTFLIAIFSVIKGVSAHAGAPLLKSGISFLKKTIISALIALITFFVCTPYTFIDSQGLEFLLGELSVLTEKAASVTGDGNAIETSREDYEIRGYANYTTALRDYFFTLFKPGGFGPVGATASIAGFIVVMFTRVRRLPFFLLLIYPLVFSVVAIIIRPGFAVVRHQTQIYPFLALIAGVLLVMLLAMLRRYGRLAPTLLVLVLLVPAISTFHRGVIVSRPDPRSEAVGWINQHLPAGSHILVGNGIVDLIVDEATLDQRVKDVDALLASGKVPDSVVDRTAVTGKTFELQRELAEKAKSFKIERLEHPWWLRRHDKVGERFFLSERDVFMEKPSRKFGMSTLDDYRERGVEYVVLGDQFRDFYHENADRYPPYSAFYEQFFSTTPVQIFPALHPEYGSRAVYVFKLP